MRSADGPAISQRWGWAHESETQSALERSFELTHDLVAHLDEVALGLDLPRLPSNRISGSGLVHHRSARELYEGADRLPAPDAVFQKPLPVSRLERWLETNGA